MPFLHYWKNKVPIAKVAEDRTSILIPYIFLYFILAYSNSLIIDMKILYEQFITAMGQNSHGLSFVFFRMRVILKVCPISGI